jgi:hypothetical protein
MRGLAGQRSDKNSAPIRASRAVTETVSAAGSRSARTTGTFGTTGMHVVRPMQFALRAVPDAGFEIEQGDAQSGTGHTLDDRRCRRRKAPIFCDVEPGDFGCLGGLHGRHLVDAVRRHAHSERGAGRGDEHEADDREHGGAAFHRML